MMMMSPSGRLPASGSRVRRPQLSYRSSHERVLGPLFVDRWVPRRPDIEIIAFSTARRANDIRDGGRFFPPDCTRRIYCHW